MSGLVDTKQLAALLDQQGLSNYKAAIIQGCETSNANHHGCLADWLEQIDDFPDVLPEDINLINSVKLNNTKFDSQQQILFKQQLLNLSPWRKGPFDLFGIHIDTEWRSDLKWQRVVDKLDLQDKLVLDVGCGNGYYMFRMLGVGAKCVIGIEPVALYVIQFKAINKYVRSCRLQLLPIELEQLPHMPVFDTVFSMGVLYHRRSPIDHLADLKSMLVCGGELILETLVIEGGLNDAMVPKQRYAGMKNVWLIPSVAKLKSWLEQTGFKEIELLDCSPTTLDEQRQTEWMRSYSLNQFLNPENHKQTIEGYPAPVRAMIKCSA